MDYIRITDDNIEKEHICCAMSGKQGVIKKEWLKQRFKEGLVFCRSTERGKCFIEYIPAENAWVPIQADGYFYIDCLWVSGSMKGHIPTICWESASGTQRSRDERDCAFSRPRGESGSFSPTRSIWHIRDLPLPIHRNAGSI